eukprot:Rmarinus@m.13539
MDGLRPDMSEEVQNMLRAMEAGEGNVEDELRLAAELGVMLLERNNLLASELDEHAEQLSMKLEETTYLKGEIQRLEAENHALATKASRLQRHVTSLSDESYEQAADIARMRLEIKTLRDSQRRSMSQSNAEKVGSPKGKGFAGHEEEERLRSRLTEAELALSSVRKELTEEKDRNQSLVEQNEDLQGKIHSLEKELRRPAPIMTSTPSTGTEHHSSGDYTIDSALNTEQAVSPTVQSTPMSPMGRRRSLSVLSRNKGLSSPRGSSNSFDSVPEDVTDRGGIANAADENRRAPEESYKPSPRSQGEENNESGKETVQPPVDGPGKHAYSRHSSDALPTVAEERAKVAVDEPSSYRRRTMPDIPENIPGVSDANKEDPVMRSRSELPPTTVTEAGKLVPLGQLKLNKTNLEKETEYLRKVAVELTNRLRARFPSLVSNNKQISEVSNLGGGRKRSLPDLQIPQSPGSSVDYQARLPAGLAMPSDLLKTSQLSPATSDAFSATNVDLSGYLYVQAGMLSSRWSKRYFKVEDGRLCWYAVSSSMFSSELTYEPDDTVAISDIDSVVMVSLDDEKLFPFAANVSTAKGAMEEVTFAASTAERRNYWTKELQSILSGQRAQRKLVMSALESYFDPTRSLPGDVSVTIPHKSFVKNTESFFSSHVTLYALYARARLAADVGWEKLNPGRTESSILRHWLVWRRHSDFALLHETLQQIERRSDAESKLYVTLPSLPAAKAFNKRRSLEEYVNAILAMVESARTEVYARHEESRLRQERQENSPTRRRSQSPMSSPRRGSVKGVKGMLGSKSKSNGPAALEADAQIIDEYVNPMFLQSRLLADAQARKQEMSLLRKYLCTLQEFLRPGPFVPSQHSDYIDALPGTLSTLVCV